MKKLIFTLVISITFNLFVSCKKDSNPIKAENGIDYSTITNIKYTDHVQALFDNNCVKCHGGQNAPKGLKLDSWENVMKGSDLGRVVIPFDADSSSLFEMLTKLQPIVHPKDQGESALDINKTNFLARWINEGAKNDNGDVQYANINNIQYTSHVQALLDESCIKCHSGLSAPRGLQMDSWANLIKGSDFGEAIIPGDSENSLMIEMLTKLQPNAHPSNHGESALDTVKTDFLARWIDEGAKNDNGDVPYSNSQNLLYVCSQGEAIVNIIDADAKVVIRNIHLTDFGFPPSSKPHHIAFSPDKNYWFVSCISTEVNKVLKFDVATNQLVGEVETEIPALLDHHPTENILYVSRFMDDNNLTSIFAANSLTMQPDSNNYISDGVIELPPSLTVPHAIGVSKNGNYVYSTSLSEDYFVIVKHDTREFEDAILLGNDRTPLQLVVSPDDNYVYISCIKTGTGEIVVMNVADSTNRFEETSINLGGKPWHSVFSTDGSVLYAANFMLNNFAVINTSDKSFQTYGMGDGTDGLSQPHGIEISDDQSHVFISGRNTTGAYTPRNDFGDNSLAGTVTFISTADNSITKVLEIENFGSGMRFLAK